jgi:hypothetical protein
MDQETAKKLIGLMLDCSKKLDDAIVLMTESASGDDAMKLRRAAGKIMGHIFLEILDPVYREHPELEPEELRSQRR